MRRCYRRRAWRRWSWVPAAAARMRRWSGSRWSLSHRSLRFWLRRRSSIVDSLITEAAAFLQGRIRRTPVEFSRGLSQVLGVPVWLKLESMQLTGSFKIRGALFRISRLTAEERRDGVVTCSAGNHGKAVAYAAHEAGVHATICVPRSVDRAKYEGMTALGAEVRISEFDGYDDTQDWALQIAAEQGRTFISPFDDYAVMAA